LPLGDVSSLRLTQPTELVKTFINTYSLWTDQYDMRLVYKCTWGFRVLSRPKTENYCSIFLPCIYIPHDVSPYTTQYYCPILHSARGVRTSEHVKWYRCCWCGHCFSPVFRQNEAEYIRRAEHFKHTRFYIFATDTQQYIHFCIVQIYCSVSTM
jgi:hypothetical protein